MKCKTCRHANLLVVQPAICHLHEYEDTAVSTVDLKNKVDYAFYYDLTRLTLNAISGWSNGSLIQSYSPLCSSLTEGVGGVSDFPLEHVLFQETDDFHGKYGEFVIHSREDSDVEQVTRSNYQDEAWNVYKVEFIRNGRTMQKQGSWFYGEPAGSIISRAYDEEEAGGGDASGAAASGGEGSGCANVVDLLKSNFDGYTFLVYHVSFITLLFRPYLLKHEPDDDEMLTQHPPFITVHSENITVNSSLEQQAVAKGSLSETWKLESGEEKVYFSGFLIDLLKEIAIRYQQVMKKEFPKHRVIVSRLFAGINDPDGAKGGGFGTKELPKAATKDGEEVDTSKRDFRGLVQEVRCGSKTIALMPMTPTPERKIFVSFTEPFFDVVSLSILMKKPVLQ